jgi:uncharacterized protein
VECIVLLLAAGAIVDEAGGRDRVTPLMQAAAGDHADAIAALLGAGAWLHRADANGSTALHHAAAGLCKHAVAALLDAGASADALTVSGRRPSDLVRACARA